MYLARESRRACMCVPSEATCNRVGSITTVPFIQIFFFLHQVKLPLKDFVMYSKSRIESNLRLKNLRMLPLERKKERRGFRRRTNVCQRSKQAMKI